MRNLNTNRGGTTQLKQIKTNQPKQNPRLQVSKSRGQSSLSQENSFTQKTADPAISYRVSKFKPNKFFQVGMVALAVLLAALVPGLSLKPAIVKTLTIAQAWGDGNVEVWWPTDQAKVSGTQPFKALLNSKQLSEYKMLWQVDGGQKNEMGDSSQDYPHKESMVDLSGWNWKGAGPYTLTFTAVENGGNQVGQKFIVIYLNEVRTAAVEKAEEPALMPTIVSATTATPIKNLSIWWPSNNANVSGTQPFKAVVDQANLNDYKMFWQVDGGHLNQMNDSSQDAPHKESMVDLSGWNWKGSGPYMLTFVAKDSTGQELAKSSASIFVNKTSGYEAITPRSLTLVSAIIEPSPIQNSGSNPFSGAKLYVNPNSDPARQANSWRISNPYNAQLMDKVASGAEVQWFGGWNNDIKADVSRVANEVSSAGALPVFVAYNIPQRDCGGYSAGGVGSPEAYKNWIRAFADGLGGRKAVVILEPDALALTDCLSPSDLQNRYNLLRDAAEVFKSKGAAVYLDAGHPGWISASDMANRLKQAGVEQVNGFALNISNFTATGENISYGKQISSQIGGKHFIIDTGRNGSGPAQDNQWCNPSGRSLGTKPTTNTGESLVDAFLWVKGPGGSDGQCAGGPSAGIFWADYALGLASRTTW